MSAITSILPVRNAAQWLPRTLPAILSNLSPIDQLIVINDGSTDSSLSHIKTIASGFNVRILDGRGRGLVSSLNMGLEQAEHEWIARFDADDFYPSDRLIHQRQQIRHDVGVIFTDYEFFLNGTTSLGVIPSPIFDFATRLSLLRSQRTAHPSVIFRKDLVAAVGGYRESEFPAEDLGLWLRLAKFTKIESSPHIGLYYNLNNNSISSRKYAEAKLKTRIMAGESLRSGLLDDFHAKEVESTLNRYSNSRLGVNRRLLHIYDLLQRDFLKYVSKSERKLIIQIAIHELSKPAAIKGAAEILVDAIRRRVARKG